MPKVWNMRDPNKPKDAVYVGRPSIWGNPFKLWYYPSDIARERVIQEYRIMIMKVLAENSNALDSLKGKDLVCYCAPLPCHADILLELANR